MKLGVLATGIALAVTLVVMFVLCALVEIVKPDTQASHMWIALFTTAPVSAAAAWVEGIIWSVVLGFAAGAVFAGTYNAVARKA